MKIVNAAFLGGLFLLLALIRPAGAETAVVDSLRVSSRSGRVILPIPGSGCRGLLEPGGIALLRIHPLAVTSRLEHGRLLVSESPELGTPSMVRMELAGTEVSFLPGRIALEVLATDRARVHVVDGRLQFTQDGRSFQVMPGQTMALERGRRPVVTRIADEDLGGIAPILEDLGRDPLPEGSETSLAGSVEIFRGPGQDPYPIQAYPLDPAMKPLTVEAFVATSQDLEVPGPDSPLLLPVVPGSDRVAFRVETRAGTTLELSLEVHFEAVQAGYLLENRVRAGYDNHVAALVDPDLMLVSSRGGAFRVLQPVDEDLEPVGRTRIEVLSGFTLFQTRRLGPAPALRLADLEIEGPDLELGAPDNRALQLDGWLLAREVAADVGPRLMGDLEHLLEIGRSAPGPGPGTGAAAALKVISVLQTLPRSVDELFTFLPFHYAALDPGDHVRISFLRPARKLGLAAASLWVYELDSPALREGRPSVEVFLRSMIGAVGPTSNVPHCRVMTLAHGHPWASLETVQTAEKEQRLDLKRRASPAFDRLGRVAIAVMVVLLCAVIGVTWLVYRGMRGWENRACPHCDKVMDRHHVLRGGALEHVAIFEELSRVDDLLDPDAVQAHRRRLEHLAETLAGRVWGPLVADASAYWCFRCEEGILQTRLLHQGRPIDERETPFRGTPVSCALRDLGRDGLPGLGSKPS